MCQWIRTRSQDVVSPDVWAYEKLRSTSAQNFHMAASMERRKRILSVRSYILPQDDTISLRRGWWLDGEDVLYWWNYGIARSLRTSYLLLTVGTASINLLGYHRKYSCTSRMIWLWSVAGISTAGTTPDRSKPGWSYRINTRRRAWKSWKMMR